MSHTTIHIHRVLGTTDEVDACDCCGRTGLKSTVALETEEGETVHFGVVCAARASGRAAKVIRAEAREADDARKEAERAAWRQNSMVRHQRWIDFLIAQTGGIYDWQGKPCIISMIEKAGGYDAANALYNATK